MAEPLAQRSGFDLSNRVAIVTGGSRNIGRQICLALAHLGADVVVHSRSNSAGLGVVVREIEGTGRRSIGVLADISRFEDVEEMMRNVLGEFGRIDILVNNAAIRPHAAFVDMSMSDWHRAIAVNLDGAFHCAKEVVPAMIKQGGGSIINLSGSAVFTGGIGQAAVAASKSGLHGLTAAMAFELGPHNIRVNAVVPHFVETARDVPLEPARVRLEMRRIPLGRFAQPSEIASVCAFLATDGASYVTGQTIHVNGGRLMT